MSAVEASATFRVAIAVAEAIRDLKSVPSGHLYARLMDRMSLESYEAIVAALVKAKLVERSNHVLTWVGPKD